jgi:hypothetical protein
MGVNMTCGNVAPFLIGRPNFDGAIMAKQRAQGWFVTGCPAIKTYHMAHPDRVQFAKKFRHPNSIWNKNLQVVLNGREWRNEEIDLRVSLTEMSERKNGTWHHFRIDRPRGTCPLAYPPDRVGWIC